MATLSNHKSFRRNLSGGSLDDVNLYRTPGYYQINRPRPTKPYQVIPRYTAGCSTNSIQDVIRKKMNDVSNEYHNIHVHQKFPNFSQGLNDQVYSDAQETIQGSLHYSVKCPTILKSHGNYYS